MLKIDDEKLLSLYIINTSTLEQQVSVNSKVLFSQHFFYTYRFVRQAGLIVFLNKQDLLKRKIEQGRKIEKYFPEYSNFNPNNQNHSEGQITEYDKVNLFIEKKIRVSIYFK